MAVLVRTASAPNSNALHASLGLPIPASGITGKLDSSIIILKFYKFLKPWFDPIDDPKGIIVTQPNSSK